MYALPAILVHRRKLVGPQAATIWVKLATAAARSSFFLALYCALAWRGALPYSKTVHLCAAQIHCVEVGKINKLSLSIPLAGTERHSRHPESPSCV